VRHCSTLASLTAPGRLVARMIPGTHHVSVTPAAARPRILVVEDDHDIGIALGELLGEQGYDVVTCEDGRRALELLQQRAAPAPDLIVLDLMMPVMDGWEFRQRQRENPEVAKIPVLAISADTSPKAAAIHADAYLRKPVDGDHLLHEVKRILLEQENRHMREQLDQVQRLAAIGALAATVEHEIRNPLTCVLANLRLAQEALAPMVEGPAAVPAPAGGRLAEVQALVRDAQTGADRIRIIVRDLELRAHIPEPRHELLWVQDAADTAIAMAAGALDNRVVLTRDYRDAPVVSGDETRLVQVLVNLLLNAVQAMPPGRAADDNHVCVVIRRQPPRVLIEVADNGMGVHPTVRARLFQPFVTTRELSGGSGLGLSVVQEIIAAHGGKVSFETKLGHGSVFRVLLPEASGAGMT
jgi:signal transduction histidine kinase